MENPVEETRPTPAVGEASQPSAHATDAPVQDDTLAIAPVPSSESNSSPRPPNNSRAWRWLALLSLLALAAIAAASAYGGYRSGINQRLNLESTQVAQQIQQQFELGDQDLQAQRYVVARQRFEFVIQHNPSYPGVTEKLAQVLLALNTTATPTVAPSPTLTPTPDLRGVEELFAQAQTSLAASDWDSAIDTLLKLRKDQPDYQPVQVDAMLYVALRNRGVYKILNLSDLEGGTYDLALAEQFGPLDVEAENYRTWADLYSTGASFWDLDWQQVIYYFGQIIQAAPNLRDSSNMTATERYRLALFKYADFLAESGEWCLAKEQYDFALNYSPDPAVEPTAAQAAQECEGKQQNEKPRNRKTEAPPPEATPPPGGDTPTEAPPPPGSTEVPTSSP